MPVHLRTWEAHDATTAALLALEPQRQERRRSECKECGSGPWHMCECGGEHSQTRARFDLARFGERGGDPPCPTPRRFRTARFLIRIHVAGPEPLSGWVGCNFLRTGQLGKKTGCSHFVTLNFHLYR